MPLLWRSTHYRGRRKVEEYSSSEVPDSDNNSIKESVEFSEPSFRTIFCRISFGSRFENRVTDFLPTSCLEVTSTEREREREREDFLVLVCFRMRKRSAIYSAPGGAVWSEPIQQLQRFGLNRCNGSTQPPQPLAVQLVRQPLAERFGSGQRSGSVGGAVRIRVACNPYP